jgi:hypothetical protein
MVPAFVVLVWLLLSVTPAFAECACVLWQEQSFYETGAFSHAIWAVEAAMGTEKQCRNAAYAPFERKGVRTAPGSFPIPPPEGFTVRVRSVCLPEGADPRAPKAK